MDEWRCLKTAIRWGLLGLVLNYFAGSYAYDPAKVFVLFGSVAFIGEIIAIRGRNERPGL